jgi:phosphoribosylamine-glycine ligase
MVVSGVADTVEKSAEKPYKIIDKLIFPNSVMYRTDAGCRVIKQLPELQAMGYATEWIA